MTSKGVFQGDVSHLDQPRIAAGCKGRGALTLRRARMTHQESCCHCLPYGSEEPELNSRPLRGQLPPPHHEDGSPAARSPQGREELLQGFHCVEQERSPTEPLCHSDGLLFPVGWGRAQLAVGSSVGDPCFDFPGYLLHSLATSLRFTWGHLVLVKALELWARQRRWQEE